jgi:hypothetical protein
MTQIRPFVDYCLGPDFLVLADRSLSLLTRSGICSDLLFLLWANNCADRLDNRCVRQALVPSRGCHGFQNLLNFRLPDSSSASGLRGWLNGKLPFSREMNCRLICHPHKAGRHCTPSFLAFAFSSSIAFVIHCPMADTTVHAPAALVAPSASADDSGHDSGAKSAAMTASSPTRGATRMAAGEILELTDFFKKTTVTEDNRRPYHDREWLTGNLVSFIPEVDVPTVEGSTIICFESQLAAGVGLPPSKFLSSIMNYLGCSLVHFNSNAVLALSSFVMLCECWLGIPLDTSLFWYYYSLVRYTKTIFGGISFSLRRNRRDGYIKATFKGCWKGAQQKWILVDIHDQPPWVNKLLFPPAIKNKRSEPLMTNRLAALTKRVTELCQAGLEVCHCVKEFNLQRIHPLGR